MSQRQETPCWVGNVVLKVCNEVLVEGGGVGRVGPRGCCKDWGTGNVRPTVAVEWVGNVVLKVCNEVVGEGWVGLTGPGDAARIGGQAM